MIYLIIIDFIENTYSVTGVSLRQKNKQQMGGRRIRNASGLAFSTNCLSVSMYAVHNLKMCEIVRLLTFLWLSFLFANFLIKVIHHLKVQVKVNYILITFFTCTRKNAIQFNARTKKNVYIYIFCIKVYLKDTHSYSIDYRMIQKWRVFNFE